VVSRVVHQAVSQVVYQAMQEVKARPKGKHKHGQVMGRQIQKGQV
jgi:hypothetical protein